MAGADLVFKPVARIFVAVTEEDGAGRNLADEIKQVVAVGVGGEVVVLHFAFARDLAGAGAEHKRLALLGSLQASARRAGVGVTDEEDGLPFVAGHADGEVVGGGVL